MSTAAAPDPRYVTPGERLDAHRDLAAQRTVPGTPAMVIDAEGRAQVQPLIQAAWLEELSPLLRQVVSRLDLVVQHLEILTGAEFPKGGD